jgi:hypothetical protein
VVFLSRAVYSGDRLDVDSKIFVHDGSKKAGIATIGEGNLSTFQKFTITLNDFPVVMAKVPLVIGIPNLIFADNRVVLRKKFNVVGQSHCIRFSFVRKTESAKNPVLFVFVTGVGFGKPAVVVTLTEQMVVSFYIDYVKLGYPRE